MGTDIRGVGGVTVASVLATSADDSVMDDSVTDGTSFATLLSEGWDNASVSASVGGVMSISDSAFNSLAAESSLDVSDKWIDSPKGCSSTCFACSTMAAAVATAN